MDYAMVDTLEGATFCSDKKIAKQNILFTGQVNLLMSKLNAGDTVWIASVTVFPSVQYFFAFTRSLMAKEIKLRILQQPRLEFGNGKCWKNSTQNYICRLRQMEIQIPALFFRGIHLDTNSQNFVREQVQYSMIRILAETFSKDGILSRN